MNQVYEIITSKIIELLERGTIPWQKPWLYGYPKNLVTGKAYRGLNIFVLNAVTLDKGYKSCYWLSYKQCQERGGQVRKGEKSTPVIFWKWIVKDSEESSEDIKQEMFPMLRYYNVFNVEQCDNLDYPIPVLPNEFESIQAAEEIVSNMPLLPEIKHVGGRAYYSPLSDYIQMPPKEYFESNKSYYATLFHELVHSTGHQSRLDRFTPDVNINFGSNDYSQEELVAELGASMLCGVCGIVNDVIDNSASYIASWLEVLKNDKKFIVMAASKSQKAADYIQGIEYKS